MADDPGQALAAAVHRAPLECEQRGAWTEVDLATIAANLAYARQLIPYPTRFMAVVKADGYGHGMIEVARTALAWGCEWLGVGNLAEGVALRQAGLDAPCLVMAPPLPGEAASYIRFGLVPSIDAPAQAEAIAAAAAAAGAGLAAVHLLVDTGMGRFGVTPYRLSQLGRAAAALPELRIGGVYTHFPRPTKPARLKQDLDRFLRACAALEGEIGQVPMLHAAGSEAAVLVPEARLDLVRLGNLMYGYWGGARRQLPDVAGARPRRAWSLRCTVVALKDVARGQALGYGGFRAPRRMRLAVLPVGLADGVGLIAVQGGSGPGVILHKMVKEAVKSLLPRYRAAAIVGGVRARVVGRVGMQFTLVDVTDIAGVKVGDSAEIPGVRATAASRLPRRYVGADRP